MRVFLVVGFVGLLGCTSSRASDEGAFALTSGDYDLRFREVPVNECWPDETWIDYATVIEIPVTILDEPPEGTLYLLPAELLRPLWPPALGWRDADGFTIAGARSLVFDTSCTLSAVELLEAELTGDDQFSASLTFQYSAEPDFFNAYCSAFEGSVWIDTGYREYNVGFPQINGPVPGHCRTRLELEGFAED